MLNVFEGQLTDVRVLPDTNQFNAITDYQIYFVTTNTMEKNSYIKIQFPSSFYKFSTTATNQPCTAIKNI